MNRKERILGHTKANLTSIVSKKPSDTEGDNGDFAVGITIGGVSLFAKINNKWYEFASDTSMETTPRVRGTAWHFHEAAHTNNHTFFVQLNGFGIVGDSVDGGDAADYTDAAVLILPFDTRVLTMSLWGAPVLGDVTVSIYNVPNGTRADSSVASQFTEISSTVNFSAAYTTQTINFSGDYTLKAGSGMYIKFIVNGGENPTWIGQDEGEKFVFSFILTLDLDVPV